MLTNLSDELLADYSDEEIADFINAEYGSPPEGATAHYIAALRMEPKLREAVFKLFRSAPLLCNECGRPSCVHGYSDE